MAGSIPPKSPEPQSPDGESIISLDAFRSFHANTDADVDAIATDSAEGVGRVFAFPKKPQQHVVGIIPKPGVRKVRDVPHVRPTVPSISGGRIGENVDVATLVAEKQSAHLRGKARLFEVVGAFALPEDGPISPEDTARALVNLRDADLNAAFSEQTFHNPQLLDDDKDMFIPVATLLLSMMPKDLWRNRLNDDRVVSVIRLLRRNATFQKLVGYFKEAFSENISS